MRKYQKGNFANGNASHVFHERSAGSDEVSADRSICGVEGTNKCAYPGCPGIGEPFTAGRSGQHQCSYARCSLFIHGMCFNEFWSKNGEGRVHQIESLDDLRCIRHAKRR